VGGWDRKTCCCGDGGGAAAAGDLAYRDAAGDLIAAARLPAAGEEGGGPAGEEGTEN
jgi:hypothetical protein